MLYSLCALSYTRSIWLLMGICALGALLFSCVVMQNYLFLQPCEQCVYIRYALMVLGWGCLIVGIFPKNIFFRLCGGIVICYALVRGITFSLTLENIHKALQSEAVMFGFKGCSLTPQYDFGLLWHVWIPQVFRPSGFCGVDVPMVGEALLSPLQKSLIEFYSAGWYLIPAFKLGSMAQCAFAIFVCYALLALCLFLIPCFYPYKTHTKHS